MQTMQMAPEMRAWVFDSATGGAVNHLRLESNHPIPRTFRDIPKGYTLVRVLSASLNPVDLKISELPVIGRLLQRLPATPGLDFAGRVVKTTNPSLQEGQLVAGKTVDRVQHGTTAEFTLVPNSGCVAVPEGVSPHQAATVGTCGVTAYQALAPNVKPGAKVFINGGSGGTGVFQIQVAKLLGCHVTTSCSGANVELCRSLGADEVLNYQEVNIPRALVERVKAGDVNEFDLVIDNVGQPWELFKAADHCLKPGGKFVQVGLETSWADIKQVLWINLLPSFLGGGKRKWMFLANRRKASDISQILSWMAEGGIRVPVEEVVPFEDVQVAYRKLASRRTKGKIVVEVCRDQ